MHEKKDASHSVKDFLDFKKPMFIKLGIELAPIFYFEI